MEVPIIAIVVGFVLRGWGESLTENHRGSAIGNLLFVVGITAIGIGSYVALIPAAFLLVSVIVTVGIVVQHNLDHM